MNTLKNISLAITLAAAAAAAAGAAHAADANATPAGRVIDVTPQTRSINVTQGELVTLKVAGQSLSWQVNTPPNLNSVPLARLVPSAAFAQPVTVYVAPGQPYVNG